MEIDKWVAFTRDQQVWWDATTKTPWLQNAIKCEAEKGYMLGPTCLIDGDVHIARSHKFNSIEEALTFAKSNVLYTFLKDGDVYVVRVAEKIIPT